MLWRLVDFCCCCNTNPITFKIINLCTYQKGKNAIQRKNSPVLRLPYAHFALSTVDRLRGEFSVCHDKEEGAGNGNGSCLLSVGIFFLPLAPLSSVYPHSQALIKNSRAEIYTECTSF